jgi:para-aminobenzoate synthetase component 1
MRVERIADSRSAPAVLRAVAGATSRLGLPPPAALSGDWFGSRAVIAPSVAIEAVSEQDVFAVKPGTAGVHVGGGWVGYLAYPDPGADEAAPRVPTAAGGWTDDVLRQDADGVWWYENLSGATMPGWLVDALATSPAPAPWQVEWTAPDRDVHHAGVLACLEEIRAGEVYQACVCTQFVGTLRGAPVDFFADGVARTSPARAAFVAGDWGAVASLSPELFLRRVGETVTSSPIKGTMPLDRPPAALRASVKDVAENVMIVDLVRNDLSRIAVTGSVTVPELLAVRRAPGVWHLVSTVSARVPVDVPMSRVVEATFPPASVTGTPKARARDLLSTWEPRDRGIYCGTVGFASPLAGTELNVAIRTVEFDAAGRAVLGVGGGITADSDPAAEWQECLDKAAAIVGVTRSADATHATQVVAPAR